MDFIEKQLEKEKVAVKKVWSGSLTTLSIYWGLLGVILLFSPGWPIGIILVGSALYVHVRKNQSNNLKK